MRLNMDKKSHAAVALSVDLDALMGDPVPVTLPGLGVYVFYPLSLFSLPKRYTTVDA